MTYSVRLQGRAADVCGLESAGVPAAHAVASLTVALFRFVNNILSVPLLAFIYSIGRLTLEPGSGDQSYLVMRIGA